MRGGGRVWRRLAAATLTAVTVAVALGGAVAVAGAARARADASSAYTFAPYVDVTGDPAPNLVALHRDAGVRQISLGFITASGGTRCVARWGGFTSLTASGGTAFRRGNVAAFERSGGQAVVSFGGAAGVELAVACRTPRATAAAYAAPIAAYHPTRLDFDIEGSTVANRAATTRRDAAIAALQRAHRRLRMSFTLPVLPSGLDAAGLAVVRDAIRHHVTLTYINLMTMDYGDDAAPHPAGRMGAYAIAAARATLTQLARLYPRKSAVALRHMLGLTPMIGLNDTVTETFGLSDARQLASYARRNGIGLLAMWALGRDRACPRQIASASDSCSGVAQTPFAFARALTG